VTPYLGSGCGISVIAKTNKPRDISIIPSILPHQSQNESFSPNIEGNLGAKSNPKINRKIY
jgi:uncharacterized RmlC-like cupin family protein